jgi:hypothetical protein
LQNRRILKWRHPGPHKLDRLASSTPGVEPIVTSPVYDALPASTVAETLPLQRDPLLPQRQRILASIDVFVDDCIGAAQGTTRRLNRICRILMEGIDDVFRPLSPEDPSHRREPISVKKLRQGDASWSTVKKVLGWVIDSVAMTLTLPVRRLSRLADLLASIPLTQQRLSLEKWHSLLGELRSMAIALPGSRGLFSALQVALRSAVGTRLRLNKGFHDALTDFRWLHRDLASRPTRLQELVPVTPMLVGAHDASGYGTGGVWLPGPTAQPRSARVRSLRPDGTLRRHRLRGPHPIIWRVPIPVAIQARLFTRDNRRAGDITNSD